MEESTNAGTQDFMYPPHTRAGGDLQRMQDVDDTRRILEHVHVNMRVWFSTEIPGTLCGLRPRGMSCSVERHISAASIALLKAAAGKLPTAGHSEPTRGEFGARIRGSQRHSQRPSSQVKSAETCCEIADRFGRTETGDTACFDANHFLRGIDSLAMGGF